MRLLGTLALIVVVSLSAFRSVTIGPFPVVLAASVVLLVLIVAHPRRHLLALTSRCWPLLLVLALQVTAAALATLTQDSTAAAGRVRFNLVALLGFVIPLTWLMRRQHRWMRNAGWVALGGVLVFMVAPYRGNVAELIGAALSAARSGDPQSLNTELYIRPALWWGETLGSDLVVAPAAFRHQLLEGALLGSLIAVYHGGRRAVPAFYAVTAVTFMSLSRSLMLALVIVFTAVMLSRSRQRGAGISRRHLILVVAALLVVTGPTLIPRLSGADTASYESRGLAVSTYFDIWFHDPVLGDADAYEEVGFTAHNLVIDWAVIYGLLGIVAALVLLGAVARIGLRALRATQTPNGTHQHLAVAGLATIVMVRFFTTGGATLSPAMWMATAFVLIAGQGHRSVVTPPDHRLDQKMMPSTAV